MKGSVLMTSEKLFDVEESLDLSDQRYERLTGSQIGFL